MFSGTGVFASAVEKMFGLSNGLNLSHCDLLVDPTDRWSNLPPGGFLGVSMQFALCAAILLSLLLSATFAKDQPKSTDGAAQADPGKGETRALFSEPKGRLS